MNYVDEINHRNNILKQVREGQKISPQDRLWLSTHRIYNRLLGHPYLNTDMINLQPNKDYNVIVRIEKLVYTRRIIPVITVPGGKGSIVTNARLTRLDGNPPSKKGVKMLGLLLDSQKRETEFTYRSALGIMGVSYECDYFDDKQEIIIRKDSSVGDPYFAMLSENIDNNKKMYRCKIPMREDFEQFSFSVEWRLL